MRFRRYADLFRHVNKLDNRFSLHFAHDVSAMDFYGDLAAAQLGRDLLVQFSADHEMEDFTFARSQRLEASL